MYHIVVLLQLWSVHVFFSEPEPPLQLPGHSLDLDDMNHSNPHALYLYVNLQAWAENLFWRFVSARDCSILKPTTYFAGLHTRNGVSTTLFMNNEKFFVFIFLQKQSVLVLFLYIICETAFHETPFHLVKYLSNFSLWGSPDSLDCDPDPQVLLQLLQADQAVQVETMSVQ